MSNELDKLVRDIKYHYNITTEEVAVSIGYTRQHLEKSMKATSGNPKIIALLNAKYNDILQSGKQVTGQLPDTIGLLHSEIIRLKAENAAITHHMVKCFEKLGLGAAAVQMAELEEVAGQLQKLEIAKAGK